MKNLGTLAAALGAILRPVTDVQFEHFVTEYLKLDTHVIHKLFMSTSMSSFAMFHSVFKATKGCFPSKKFFQDTDDRMIQTTTAGSYSEKMIN